MDDSFMAIAFLAIASVLIIAEIFIPSGGLLALGMFASLFAAFYYAWVAWWETSPTTFFGFTAFAIVVIPSVTISALTILPKTKFGKRILLAGPSAEEVVPFAKEEERLNGYVGRIAKAITPLNPGGMVSIDRERIHAYSEGLIIESGADVEIIKVNGTRVLVREVRTKQEPTEVAKTDPPTSDEPLKQPETPLDFDLSDAE